MGETSAVNPADRRYAMEHQWVRPGADGRMVIGPTWFLHEQLVGPMHLELPDVGEHVEQGEMCGYVQSLLGAMRELHSPLAGTVVAVNEELLDDPEMIAVNDDPYGEGWLFELEPDEPEDVDRLLTAEEYSARTPYARRWQLGLDEDDG
jgi:glycine cleavage system H protein